MELRRLFLAVLLASVALPAYAQQARVVTACGSLAPFGPVAPGGLAYPTIDLNGNLCLSGGSGPGPGGANTVVTKFSPLAQVNAASPVCQLQGCTPTGTGYGASVSGTLTLTTNGGKFVCSPYPVLNVSTNAGGAVTTVSSVGAAGSCTAMGGTGDEVWTTGGALSAGSNAFFALTWGQIVQTWTPANATTLKAIRVFVLSGGGQGAGGANTNSGTASSGGAGGGGAAEFNCTFSAANVGSAAQTVYVGLGGRNGGNPGTTASSPGTSGQAGSISYFGSTSANPAYSLCAIGGGGPGYAGQNSATVSGGGGGGGMTTPIAFSGGAAGGAMGGGSGGNGVIGNAATSPIGGGGGGGGSAAGVSGPGGQGITGGGSAGGGITTAPVANGSASGGNAFPNGVSINGSLGVAANARGNDGQPGTGTVYPIGITGDSCGGASGGGAGLTTTVAGNGGNGCQGSAGGGGGSVVAGTGSGAGFGGAGGDGEVYVLESY